MNKEQIYRHLPRVSAHWLLTDGEGEMIVPEVKESPPTDDANHLKKRIVERDRLFPTLSTYYARHSWASIAAELGAPVETISLGLGHRYGPSVTQTYITPSLRLLDECNRMVLDAVTKSAKC